jgi:hypothetical protein
LLFFHSSFIGKKKSHAKPQSRKEKLRQDEQDKQDFLQPFYYPVNPVNPVKKTLRFGVLA